MTEGRSRAERRQRDERIRDLIDLAYLTLATVLLLAGRRRRR